MRGRGSFWSVLNFFSSLAHNFTFHAEGRPWVVGDLADGMMGFVKRSGRTVSTRVVVESRVQPRSSDGARES